MRLMKSVYGDACGGRNVVHFDPGGEHRKGSLNVFLDWDARYLFMIPQNQATEVINCVCPALRSAVVDALVGKPT